MNFNKEIKLNKELNKLDKFVIDFCKLLDRYVIVSGYVSILFGRSRSTEDVDLLIVGDLVLPQLSGLVSKFEQELKREINYSAMTKDEFNFRKKRRDPFILKVLSQSRIMLIGDEEEMV